MNELKAMKATISSIHEQRISVRRSPKEEQHDEEVDSEELQLPQLQRRFRGKEISITVQVPAWIFPRRYQLRARKAQTGWDCRFRTYYPTSFDSSPVFKLCIDGNVEGLQRLFDARLASPFEIDKDGWTTLHVS
jgi:ribose 1,5-bisphosphokinase PhnN